MGSTILYFIMDSSDIFHLKYQEFDDNFKLNYKELRQEQEFCDVTLVSDDVKYIEAHKLILATSSSVFKDILKRNKQVHPFLYLRGINSSQLALVLDFIYHGEVKVPQMDLDSFLDVAKDLGVKGLMDNLGSRTDKSAKKKKSRNKKPTPPPPVMKLKEEPTRFPTTSSFDYDFINDNIKFEDIMGEIQEDTYDHEEIITSVIDVDGSNLTYTFQNNSIPMDGIGARINLDMDTMEDIGARIDMNAMKDIEERIDKNTTKDIESKIDVNAKDIEAKIEEMIFVENGCWGCKKCGKVMKKKQHIKNHAESHLEGYSHPCPFCGKHSKTRNALTNHISFNHKHPMAKMPLSFV